MFYRVILKKKELCKNNSQRVRTAMMRAKRPTLQNSFRDILSITLLTLISRLNYAIAIKIKTTRKPPQQPRCRNPFEYRNNITFSIWPSMFLSQFLYHSLSLEITIMMCKLNMFWLQNVDNKFYFLSKRNYRC